MGKVIAVTNQKGGVGKTTTSVNLSASLAATEHSTLMIDMDPQANGSSGLGIDPRTVPISVYEVLAGVAPLEETIQHTAMPFLDLVPSHINLVGAEIEMIDMPEREQVLKKVIRMARHHYDFVVIDCPPSLGLLTLNALTASDSVVIPVQAEYFALEGLGQLLNTIKIVRQHLNPDLEIEGVLMTMYDPRLRLAAQVASEVRRYFGDKVFDTIIQRNVRVAEAPSFGKPVLLHDVVSAGAKNYMALAWEVIRNNVRFLSENAAAEAPSAPEPAGSDNGHTTSPQPSTQPSTQSAPAPPDAVSAEPGAVRVPSRVSEPLAKADNHANILDPPWLTDPRTH